MRHSCAEERHEAKIRGKTLYCDDPNYNLLTLAERRTARTIDVLKSSS